MKIATNAAGLSPAGTFRQQFEKAKELGYDCLELWVGLGGDTNKSLTMESTEENYAEICSLIKEFDIPVKSIASGLYFSFGAFGSDDPAKSAEAVKIMRKQIEAARAIGADTILVVTNIDNDTGYGESIELTIKVFRELEGEIKEAGINIGIENVWNRFFMSPLDVAYVIDRIDNPLVGLYFDIGNMVEFSCPEWWIKECAKYIKKVHIKDFKRANGFHHGGDECFLFEGDVDFEKCIPLLKEYGYNDVITAEVPPSTTGLPRDEHIKKLCDAMRRIANIANKQ